MATMNISVPDPNRQRDGRLLPYQQFYRQQDTNGAPQQPEYAQQDMNLLGEYDFSDNKLKDSVGITLPKIAA